MSFNRNKIDKNCPCKPDCPDRSSTCHGTCEKYAGWSAKKQEENTKIRKEYFDKDIISDTKKRKIWRNKRYQRMSRYQNSIRSK